MCATFVAEIKPIGLICLSQVHLFHAIFTSAQAMAFGETEVILRISVRRCFRYFRTLGPNCCKGNESDCERAFL